MRILKLFMAFLVVATLCVSVQSCKGKAEKKEVKMEAKHHGMDKDSKELTSAYVCPMYCKGSGSHEPGKCPECGMAYVENKKSKK